MILKIWIKPQIIELKITLTEGVKGSGNPDGGITFS
jgi:hypothetical protein